MFGLDFYPTPKEVIERMLLGVNLAGKAVLEPSAGKGNIVDYCKENWASVIACEIDDNLKKVLSGKCNVIADDFLTLRREDISHVDFIVMNPPFSAQEKHILHAYDIAPSGCEIIALCNSTLLTNSYKSSRKAVAALVDMYGRSENFGNCFSNSERKTNVSVSCLHLYKEGVGEEEFDNYFDLTEDEQMQINGSGVVRYDFVQDIVSRYIEAVKAFDEVAAVNQKINEMIKGINPNFVISFGARNNSYSDSRIDLDRATFKKELQKSAWRHLFDLMEMHKYVTTGVLASINKFVEQQEKIPFTVKNIYKMVQLIIGTHGSRMDSVLVEAFEKICSFSYENSSAGEGWRTNTDFIINKKFILPRVCQTDKLFQKDRMTLDYCGRVNEIEDVVKALHYLTGTPYDNDYHNRLFYFCDNTEIGWGEAFEWSFFKIKGFKKGTMHFEFINEDVWRQFNIKVAEIKGWKNVLPHSKKGRAKK